MNGLRWDSRLLECSIQHGNDKFTLTHQAKLIKLQVRSTADHLFRTGSGETVFALKSLLSSFPDLTRSYKIRQNSTKFDEPRRKYFRLFKFKSSEVAGECGHWFFELTSFAISILRTWKFSTSSCYIVSAVLILYFIFFASFGVSRNHLRWFIPFGFLRKIPSRNFLQSFELLCASFCNRNVFWKRRSLISFE